MRANEEEEEASFAHRAVAVDPFVTRVSMISYLNNVTASLYANVSVLAAND